MYQYVDKVGLRCTGLLKAYTSIDNPITREMNLLGTGSVGGIV